MVDFSPGTTQYLEASELGGRKKERHLQNPTQQETSLGPQVWEVLLGDLQIPGALFRLGSERGEAVVCLDQK